MKEREDTHLEVRNPPDEVRSIGDLLWKDHEGKEAMN